jgi:hypothetical protein
VIFSDCSRNRADHPLSSSLARRQHVRSDWERLTIALPARSLVQTGARDFPTLAISAAKPS